MRNAFLVGEKVFLRPLEPSDAATVAPWLNAREVNRTLLTCRPFSVQAEIDFITSVSKDSNSIVLGVGLRETEQLIGSAGLDQIDQRHRHARFGILIGEKQFWGQGYATEATRLLIEHAFSMMNLNRVWLHVLAEHPAAIHVYEKIGFEREGILRQHVFSEGRYQDMLTMAILRKA